MYYEQENGIFENLKTETHYSMHYKLIFSTLALSFGMLLMISCEKSVIEYADKGTVKKEIDTTSGGGGTTPISFSNEIVPIFTSNCISCHSSMNPNLTAASAYASLTSTSKYVNTAAPETSLLYTKLTAVGSSHEGKATAADAKKILTWIKEGALNN